MKSLLIDILIVLVFASAIPVITLLLQFTLVGVNGIRNHYSKCKSYIPRVAIILPAWNEGDVLAGSIDRLLRMDYPRCALRLFVVDDASTDNTPLVVKAKEKEYPGLVFHLRREEGGQGKAHTINHGLKIILADNWAEAVLIMDADVRFETNALHKMTRHFADPTIGAVTAYIKEGSKHRNIVSNFIAFEYITAQAGARRAQNVLGVLACLAGGAQLHTRSNILAIGGQIDTSTLAEDTYTTFKTQLASKRVLFDPNAIVLAEEPDNLYGLWRQRLRWARGNIQMTLAFRHIWFRRGHPSGLGGIFFGMIWFSILLMPLFMIVSSLSLIALFFIDHERSMILFRLLIGASAIAYLFTTAYSYLLDIETTKRIWFVGILFPGLISLLIMGLTSTPKLFNLLFDTTPLTYSLDNWHNIFLLFIYAWVCICMAFAWGIYRLDRAKVSPGIVNFLLLIVGYGPILSAITLAAFVAEIRGKEIHWEKTEKKGKAQQKILQTPRTLDFDHELRSDIQTERRIFVYELLVIIFVIILLLLRQYYEL